MIFYFTATGNCLYAARQLQQELGGELYSIAELAKEGRFDFTPAQDEYVGFVFPVFFWGLPDILPRFISQLALHGARPEKTFLLATMGSSTGTACEVLQQALASRGVHAGYKFSVPMPDNYVPLFTVPGPEQVQQQLDAAQSALRQVAKTLRSAAPGDYNRKKGPLPGLLSPLIHRTYPRNTGKFYADNACTGCGLCQKVCPVSAIEVTNGQPVWVKKQCETCLACLHHCPVQAIQHGKDRRAKGRYLNPRVSL